MSGRALWRTAALGMFGGILLVTGAVAQPHGSASQTLPAGPPPAAAAVVDTALALIEGPPGWPTPTAVAIQPDSVRFGGQAYLVIDFPPAAEVSPDSLVCRADWLVFADEFAAAEPSGIKGFLARLRGRPPAGEPPPLPASEGTRISRRVRLFRPGPIQVGWGEGGEPVSSVYLVRSGLESGFNPAGIRAPRSLGWNWWLLAGCGVVALLLVLLAWYLWRRRSRPSAGPAHRSLAPPAYLDAAVALWDLHAAELLARGEGRRFLDRLASILRHYLTGRFGIRAGEMTGPEVAAALLQRGHRRPEGAEFARLLARSDDQRYAPGAPVQAACLELFGSGVQLVDQVRIEARYAPVPPDLAIRGQKSWARLQELVRAPGFPGARSSGEGR